MTAGTKREALAGFSPTQFRRDGFHILPQLLAPVDRAAARDLLRSLEDVETTPAGYEPEYESGPARRLRKVRRLLWNEPDLWAPMLNRAGVLELADELIGRDAAVVFHAAFLKAARIGTPIAPHQDQALWSYTYPGAFSVWFALSRVAPENGGLYGCPASHAAGEIPHRDRSSYPWHPSLDVEEDGLPQPIQFVLEPGDALLWDRYFVHGSGPNTSDEDRVGMVVVFAKAADPAVAAKDRFAVGDLRQYGD